MYVLHHHKNIIVTGSQSVIVGTWPEKNWLFSSYQGIRSSKLLFALVDDQKSFFNDRAQDEKSNAGFFEITKNRLFPGATRQGVVPTPKRGWESSPCGSQTLAFRLFFRIFDVFKPFYA